MTIMLPLDKLSKAAADAIVARGLSLDDMTAAVRLDLDFNGVYGETWLVFEKKTKRNEWWSTTKSGFRKSDFKRC